MNAPHHEPAVDPCPAPTLRRLGWPTMIAGLGTRTRTALGRRRADRLEPLPDRASVLDRLRRIDEVRAVHREDETLPLAGVPDIGPHLGRAEKDGILEGAALREIADAARAAAECARFLDRHREALPTVAGAYPGLGGQSELAHEIGRAIAGDGTVNDDASPALAEARARVRSLHERLRRSAEALVNDPAWKDRLQEPYFSVRGDRYVLPVRAAFRYAVGGIVHNVSNTGQTVFIEPPALVDGGNELAIASAAADEEERLVLAGLTRRVRGVADALAGDLGAIGELDLLEAMARLALDLDAAGPVVPERDDEPFDLRGLRHPLLALGGTKVVANDVRLDGEARCLVVSGPNAGGKTVTITAIALCAVMLRHGLPVPAEAESRLPLYRLVRAVSGDEQDLARGLSTFSAHLAELARLLEDATPGALLLVDEICADTDPREGAALAVAVIEALLDRGARLLVTTHLEALKALAATDARLRAAAVGFDMERMLPTYRLRLDASAGSSALEVARRAGLPAEVVDRARDHLGGDAGTLASAMRELEALQAQAAAEAGRLEAARAALAEREAELETAREGLEAERRAVRAEARETLLQDIEAARAEVKHTIAELQAKPRMRDAGELDQKLEAMAEATRTAIARAAAEPATAAGAPAGGAPPAAGDPVLVASMGNRRAEVLEVGATDALVALGSLKTRLPLEDLLPAAATARATRARTPSSAARAEPDTDDTIDLRGMRVDEALTELTRRLDRLFAEGAERARIIHGHGTGALKQAVREHLADAPYAAAVRPGDRTEGGDGVTVVELG